MKLAVSTTFTRHTPKAMLSLFAAVIFLALAFLPVASTVSQKNDTGQSPTNSMLNVSRVEAGKFGMFCGNGLGFNMRQSNGWGKHFSKADMEGVSSRKLTIQEAFGKSIQYVSYYGEGEGPLFVIAKESKPPETVQADPAKLESERTWENCTLTPVLLSVAGGTMWIADTISSITQMAISMAFNPKLVCDPDEPNDGMCLDLVNIIGGKSDSDKNSVFASLTSGLYFPLITIAAIIAGIGIFYQGVVQRKFRKAWGGVAWSLLIVIIGGIVVTKPNMMTRAPMTLSNVAASCVMGAFSGQGCDGSSTNDITPGGGEFDGKSGSDRVCQSSISGGAGTKLSQAMDTTINSATCEIWKAFVLNPYTIASFGAPFDDLDTKSGKGAEYVAAAKGVNADDFCVDLQTTSAPGQGGDLQLAGGDSVCNIAAYQLYLMTHAQSAGDSGVQPPTNGSDEEKKNGDNYDQRWYKVVDVAAANPEMWDAWTGGMSSASSKVWTGIFSVIVATVGNFILVTTALGALAFYVSGILLMAFAPIFMLIGIHDGRGRRIMFGWLEKVFSAILKYIVSAAFVVVTVSVYAGVLSAASNFAATFVFVIIVSVALFVYRKEFLEMLGKVDMGGQQLSTGLSDKLSGAGKSAMSSIGRHGASAAGGAIGSKLAGGSAMGGAKAGLKRNLKRGDGFIANAARENDSVKNNNLNNLEKQSKASRDRLAGAAATGVGAAMGTAGAGAGAAAGMLNTPEGMAVAAAGKKAIENLPGMREQAESLEKIAQRDFSQEYDRFQSPTFGDKELTEKFNSMQDGVNYAASSVDGAAQNLQADSAFMNDLTGEIMKRRPDLSVGQARQEAESFVQLSAEASMSSKVGDMHYGMSDATANLPKFNGQQEQVAGLRELGDEYKKQAQGAQQELKTRFGDMKNIDTAVMAAAPLSADEQRSKDVIGEQIKSTAAGATFLEKRDELQAQEKDLSRQMSEARNEGDRDEMFRIQRQQARVASSLKRQDSEIDGTDIGTLVDSYDSIGKEDGRNELGNVATEFTGNAQAFSDRDALKERKEADRDAWEKRLDSTQEDYNKMMDRIHNAEQDVKAYEQMQAQAAAVPVPAPAHTSSPVSEKERREVENNERMAEGLHPGQGLSRRKIRNQREKLAQQMIEDDVIPHSGSAKRAAKRYGRTQSRRDIRGQGLDN